MLLVRLFKGGCVWEVGMVEGGGMDVVGCFVGFVALALERWEVPLVVMECVHIRVSSQFCRQPFP